MKGDQTIMNEFISFLFLFAYLFCPIAALLLLVHVVISVFSTKVSDQISKHPVVHLVWAGFAFIGVLMLFGVMSPTMWPPKSIERREQRAKLMERVRAVGGWDAVRRDCVELAAQNPNGFDSYWHHTNLPPAVAGLKPLIVSYSPQYACVRIRVFGIHSTGGHSTPYFGLEVDTSTNNIGYKHGSGYDNGGVIGNFHSQAVQIAQGVYEIY